MSQVQNSVSYVRSFFDENVKKDYQYDDFGYSDTVFLATAFTVLLLLVTRFFVDARYFGITIALLTGNSQLFVNLLSALIGTQNWSSIKLDLLNSPQLRKRLNLHQSLTDEQVNHLVTVFDQYSQNIEAQGNEAVTSWLKFKLIMEEQYFCIQTFHYRFYTNYQFGRMLRHALAKLQLIDKAAMKKTIPRSQLSAISTLGERQRSRFQQIWSTLEESVIDKIDPYGR